MKKAYWFICLLSMFFYISPAQTDTLRYSPYFWEENIRTALRSRDDFYRSLDIDRLPLHFSHYFTIEGIQTLTVKLARVPGDSVIWYHFLKGMALAPSSLTSAQTHFNQAVSLCAADPGFTWVLFFEFNQVGQDLWAEKCLQQLERICLLRGVYSAPILSRLLFELARETKSRPPSSISIDYAEWAKRFDSQGITPALLKFFVHREGIFPAVSGLIADFFHLLKNSWHFQLMCVDALYRWVRLVIIVFIMVFFIVISLRSMPVALHPLSEIFPTLISTRVRLVLSVVIYLSLLCLGPIPFLLLTGIILWPFCDTNYKYILSVCLALIVASPLDVRFQDNLRRATSPERNTGLFHRAVHEGYSPELDFALSRSLMGNPDNLIANVASATIALKQGDLNKASIRITAAEKSDPDDPCVLVTAGNILCANGNLPGAADYFSRCINNHPDFVTAYFNLGQVYLATMKMVEGNDLISRATRLNSQLVDSYIGKNTRHFGSAWPESRRFMMPDYTPEFYWKNVFRQKNTGAPDPDRWPPMFFGMPSAIFLAIVPFSLVLMLIVRTRVFTRDRVKKIFYCKLCGLPLCKKCKTGQFCLNCLQATYQTHNGSADQTVENKIVRYRSIRKTLVTTGLNLFCPGAGTLYAGGKRIVSAVSVFLVSSAFFAAYISLFTISSPYPFWYTDTLAAILMVMGGTYTVIFALFSIKSLAANLKAGEAKHVS
jgi:tetratricopeptide (TPR) repeat protein